MSLGYTPKSEEELQEAQLGSAGSFPFTILTATVQASKKHPDRDLLALKVNVHHDDGRDYHVYDYVMPWAMEHRFRHFFVAVGMEAQYTAGTATQDIPSLVGKTGWCELGIQKAKGTYGPKNIIVDYLKSAQPEARPTAEPPKPAKPAKPQPPKPDQNDDVPF